MNAKKCDRCGKFYDKNNNHYDKEHSCYTLAGITGFTCFNALCSRLAFRYDLCDSCICEFMKWIGEG